MSDLPDSRAVCAFLKKFQQETTEALERLEPEARFRRDPWDHHDGSRGETRVLEDGETFEKVGVNFSDVSGTALPEAATERHPELAGQPFAAAGVSIVAHPRNPYVPTAHCNVRFFSARAPDGTDRWWFGGGFDLTPYYGFEEDARHWHDMAREACAPFGDEVYPKFKEWCDRYFYLPHRDETRGIGGLFFDDLNEWGFERTFAFMQAVANHFLMGYLPIVDRRRETPWGERERAFQKYRRGRYVEFNLLYDRGTLFGLQNSRRTESILMSLPPDCGWIYDYQPEPGSPESGLTERFLGARDWV